MRSPAHLRPLASQAADLAPTNQLVYEGVSVKLGPRLKAARNAKSLSLRALGERTGFSASFLSQVELGQASPSLASLGRIAVELEPGGRSGKMAAAHQGSELA